MAVRLSATWILLAAVYVFAGKLGLALAFVNPSATAIWPPSGIALAAVLIFGPLAWPGIFLGAFLTNEMTAGTPTTSLLIASGNTGEALLGAYLVNRFAGGRFPFEHGRHILRFVLLAGVVACSLSATVGVTTLSMFGFVPKAAYLPTWLTWWLGDLSGALILAPALLLWSANRRVRWSAAQWAELSALCVVLLATGWMVFIRSEYPLGFLCVPICVWAACRFGQREAATATCLLSVIAIWGTLQGFGTFGEHSPNDALLLLQSFMVMTSIVGITVGAVVSRRRSAEEQLRRANEELEQRVQARATELQAAVDELVASEGRLQTIFDAEPACVKLVSPDGRLLTMNRAGLEIVGARDITQLVGRPVIDLVHPDDRRRYLEMHRSVCGGSRQRLEFRIVTMTGEERWVDARAVPFDRFSDTGNLGLAVLSVTSDITERKRLEEQLRQSQKMEAIGMLAGGIAHDFNNLLTAISGYTEIVLGTLDQDDKRREELQEVAKGAQRAAALTRQLLAFSRRQILQPAILDVNELVGEVQKLLRRTIPESIDLRLSLSPAVDSVRADRGQLEQVVLNLAINAGDAMPQGGQLTLATATVDVDEAWAHRYVPMPPGRYVRLAVSDTGVGIPPEIRSRIFDPFFTTKERGRGTGLGLATVYGIVKQSGGYIWMNSEVGRGTTFEVYLPVVHERSSSVMAIAPIEEIKAGSQTILLAEDDGAVRRLARDILLDRGYVVLDARDGDEALEVARQYRGPIHLLITDVVMPGLSGRDLAARLTIERPELRVLYTSGYADDVMTLAGFENDGALLHKPFLPADLLRRTAEIL